MPTNVASRWVDGNLEFYNPANGTVLLRLRPEGVEIVTTYTTTTTTTTAAPTTTTTAAPTTTTTAAPTTTTTAAV